MLVSSYKALFSYAAALKETFKTAKTFVAVGTFSRGPSIIRGVVIALIQTAVMITANLRRVSDNVFAVQHFFSKA